MKKAHLAVIGVGTMGINHVRILSQSDRCELVCVADVSNDLLKKVSAQYKVKGYSDYLQMVDDEKLDAVIVAVPTKLHFQVGSDIINKKISLLIEKPLAATVSECKKLISMAKEKNVLLGVGHVERFNPVIKEVKKRMAENILGKIFQIAIRRIGPFPQRVTDVGVVLDLATHDIDIMIYLIGDKIIRAYSESNRLIHSKHEDLSASLFRFNNGIIGVLVENWLSPTKIRDLSLSGEKGMLIADFITQDLFFYENNYTPSTWGSLEVFRGMAEGNMTRFYIKKEEPLKVELNAFLDAVLLNKKFMVTDEEGLEVVRISEHLIRKSKRDRL